MVRVSIEVDTGAARFRLTVRAESIARALGLAEAHHPSADARVVFPIEPEGFFVEDSAATPGPVETEMVRSVAGYGGDGMDEMLGPKTEKGSTE